MLGLRQWVPGIDAVQAYETLARDALEARALAVEVRDREAGVLALEQGLLGRFVLDLDEHELTLGDPPAQIGQLVAVAL